MAKLQLCLHHELMLLVLDDAKGNFAGTMYQYGIAGAVLSELLLQGWVKVSPEDQVVSLAMTDQSGDPVLDDVLKLISDSKKECDLKHWVYQVACQSDLCDKIAQQLVELGILSYNESKVLWLFTQKRYPELDSSYEDAIRKRLADVMFVPDTKADERTSVLISFAKTSGALDSNFAKVEMKQHANRIDEICEGKQLAAGATVETVKAVQSAMMAATVASSIAVTAAVSASN